MSSFRVTSQSQRGGCADSTTASGVATGQASKQTLLRLQSLFRQHACVQLRHLAFMLLARLGGIPPTLYMPVEEAEHASTQGELQSH